MRIQVKDFMTSPVTTSVGEKTIREIKVLMSRNHINGIPIIKYSKQLPKPETTICGIITSSDLNETIDDDSLVEEVMTQKVHIIHKNSSAHAAAEMMLKHKVHHLVVMDDGKIIGIISSMDFVKLVAQHKLE